MSQLQPTCDIEAASGYDNYFHESYMYMGKQLNSGWKEIDAVLMQAVCVPMSVSDVEITE